MISGIVAGFVLAFPGQTSCLFSPVLGYQSLADGSLAHPQFNPETLIQLKRQARERIRNTFGPGIAKPAVVFFGSERGLGIFKLNPYASTHFFGSYACITVGPKGQNVNVVAHELMHAELHERVGAWQYFFEIPVWFDEGLAMQLDHRPDYAMRPTYSDADLLAIRQLRKGSAFFVSDDSAITANYALAKESVRLWLIKIGSDSLYEQLKSVQQGRSFNTIIQ